MFERSRSFADLSDEEICEEVLERHRLMAKLQAEAAELTALAVERNAHLTPEIPQASFAWWLQRELRCAAGFAHREVRRAKLLAAMPELRTVLRNGETHLGHIDAVLPITELLPSDVLGEVQWPLIEAAVQTTPRIMKQVAWHIRHRIDPDGATESAMQADASAGLSLSEFGDGSYAINGTLSPLDGAALKAALDSLCKPRGEDDTRTPRLRRAQALGELARRQLANGELPTNGGLRPQVSVIVPLSTLLGQLGAPGAQVIDGPTLDAATVQAICCDAELTRVVHDDTNAGDTLEDRWKQHLTGLLPYPLAAPSAILDFGRSRRNGSTDQRKALNVRDGGCVRPGCTRPPSWCEIHHLNEWLADHGKTDLDELALVCEEHHHEIHRRGLRLVHLPDGSWTLVPREEQALAA